MVDIFNPEKRSQIMASISAKDTKPEIKIRHALHRRGFRYRLHAKSLPGKPDLVFKKFNAVVFVNGCFWHGHNCPLFRMPSSNRSYWTQKIDANRKRDTKNNKQLLDLNWRILTIWECSMKGSDKLDFDLLILLVENWLMGDSRTMEIRGRTEAFPMGIVSSD